MDWESVQSLREMRRLTARIRRTLDDLVAYAGAVDESIKRLASLHPELAITLVCESVLQSAVGIAVDRDIPAATLGIRLPGGIGLCVWTKRHPSERWCDENMHFVPLSQTPPVLLRLLAPHLESLLDALLLRIER